MAPPRASKRSQRPEPAEKKRIRVVQYVSIIGFDWRQRRILAGIGLRRPGTSRVLPDTPSVRGMIAKIPHLVRIEELGEAPASAAPGKAAGRPKSKPTGEPRSKAGAPAGKGTTS